MKKKVQLQLKDLAEKILEAEDYKSLSELKHAVRALYERLSVLEYLELQLSDSEVPRFEESMDSKSFREQNWFKEPQPLPEPALKDEIIEPATEKIKDLVAQMPEEAEEVEEVLKTILPEQKTVKNDWDEIASHYQEIPVFERKDTTVKPTAPKAESPKVETPLSQQEPSTVNDIDRPKSLNDAINTGLNIGLNDRLAYIKHLFDGSTDDFTRVVSQINTLQTIEEVKQFIQGQVRPDYNNWQDKDEYATRFIAHLEKRFN